VLGDRWRGFLTGTLAMIGDASASQGVRLVER
jgi:hypothetical protein